MKKHFAKLFTFAAGSQVLITRSWNADEEVHEVEITTDAESARISTKLGFGDNEIEADKAFDGYDEAAAERFIKTTAELIS